MASWARRARPPQARCWRGVSFTLARLVNVHASSSFTVHLEFAVDRQSRHRQRNADETCVSRNLRDSSRSRANGDPSRHRPGSPQAHSSQDSDLLASVRAHHLEHLPSPRSVVSRQHRRLPVGLYSRSSPVACGPSPASRTRTLLLNLLRLPGSLLRRRHALAGLNPIILLRHLRRYQTTVPAWAGA